mmetsp:Transcript_10918/g.11994  ORF Transcript_10918/g.11994 Transcript_10918/m.11994 type:complete len:243 (-) Transcript_10918:51-779(-)
MNGSTNRKPTLGRPENTKVVFKVFNGTMLKTSWHLIVLAINVAVIVWASNFQPKLIGGLSWFLTHWGHILATLYFAFASVEDLFKSRENKARWFTSSVSFTLAFVLQAVVVILFWTIFTIDQDKMVPPAVLKRIPWELILYHHGIGGLLVLLDFLFVRVQNPSLAVDAGAALCVVAAYLCATQLCKYINGVFPYPFQNDFKLMDHVIFNAFSTAFAFSMLFLKRQCVHYYHGQVKKQKEHLF